MGDGLVFTVHRRDTHVPFVNNMIELLALFRSTPRFDLYDQAPWVAGSTMAGILGSAQFLGLVLLGHHGFFGSFLHMYHMLKQLRVIAEIAPLEAFCNLFVSEIFMDHRPTTNFAGVLARFNGDPPMRAENG